jgi:hypothetical protein
MFEMNNAWTVLRAGGAMVIDDIDANWGFQIFTRTLGKSSWLVCEAEPERPDHRRFNGKGSFGVVLKRPARSGAERQGDQVSHYQCDRLAVEDAWLRTGVD